MTSFGLNHFVQIQRPLTLLAVDSGHHSRKQSAPVSDLFGASQLVLWRDSRCKQSAMTYCPKPASIFPAQPYPTAAVPKHHQAQQLPPQPPRRPPAKQRTDPDAPAERALVLERLKRPKN
jgi:hypothetical protein